MTPIPVVVVVDGADEHGVLHSVLAVNQTQRSGLFLLRSRPVVAFYGVVQLLTRFVVLPLPQIAPRIGTFPPGLMPDTAVRADSAIDAGIQQERMDREQVERARDMLPMSYREQQAIQGLVDAYHQLPAADRESQVIGRYQLDDGPLMEVRKSYGVADVCPGDTIIVVRWLGETKQLVVRRAAEGTAAAFDQSLAQAGGKHPAGTRVTI